LEVVKLELEGFGIHDINNVQAMMLFNIGDAEMTVGELTLRGCYLGSNVSYNVKKMVENEYLAHERSVHDRLPGTEDTENGQGEKGPSSILAIGFE
jgi:DNA-binding MarR family transcriptional regulator